MKKLLSLLLSLILRSKPAEEAEPAGIEVELDVTGDSIKERTGKAALAPPEILQTGKTTVRRILSKGEKQS